MGKKSRDKGAKGELEAAAFCQKWHSEARRGVSQTRGALNDNAPDVDGVVGHWVEVKRIAKVTASTWMDQAINDCVGLGVEPIVLTRADRGKWLVVVDAEAYFSLVQALEQRRCAQG